LRDQARASMNEDRFDELEDATLGMPPEEVLAFLSPLAAAGGAAAQCLLADAYDDGTLPRDRAKSVEWYRKVSFLGRGAAQLDRSAI
jgi:TPR repeat protein